MKQQGFTTLYAVLVASLLLSVGFAIFDITYKETVFSTIARNSNFAIYAADAGLECALYWDHKYAGSANFSSGSVFATSTSSQPPQSGINCSGVDIAATAVAGGTWPSLKDTFSATSTFTFTLLPRPYCAVVKVEKSGTANTINTTVTSQGYNTCSNNDPNRVERTFQANY